MLTVALGKLAEVGTVLGFELAYPNIYELLECMKSLGRERLVYLCEF